MSLESNQYCRAQLTLSLFLKHENSLSEPERTQDLLNYQRCDLCNYNICTWNRPLWNLWYDTKERLSTSVSFIHNTLSKRVSFNFMLTGLWTALKMQVLAG